MTSREVMLRTVEALVTMGMREPARLMKDARIIHAEIMELPDGETVDLDRPDGKPPKQAARQN